MDTTTETNSSPDSTFTDALKELALNLRWSWNHEADELWSELDAELWELTQNPWVMLQTVSREKLAKAMSDPAFCRTLEQLVQQKRHQEQTPRWFQRTYEKPPFNAVAYFSLEFMLSDALPIYSGGLGNVAGDQLKAASDMGVPLVGVSLLYQMGYFRQRIDADGRQQALYPFNDPGQLPIQPVRQANGEWLRVALALPGFKMWVRAWEVQVGRTKLYLLDTNDPANLPEYRGFTSELYGGGRELRIIAGSDIGNRRLAITSRPGNQTGSLPSKRRSCGIRGSRTSSQLHGGNATTFRRSPGRDTRRQSLHDTHAGSRGIRSFLARACRKALQALCAEPFRYIDARIPGLRPPESRQRVRAVQHGLSGNAR